MTYDFKNEIEELSSNNADRQEFPVLSWFCPHLLLLVKNGQASLFVDDEESLKVEKKEVSLNTDFGTKFHSSLSKEDYINHLGRIKEHILRGDIYEMNYCQEFSICLLYTSPSPRDRTRYRMPSSA